MLKVVAHNLVETIDISKVVNAYSGDPNACRCGCSGKYFYTSQNRIEGGRRRGYPVSDDEVNDKMVRKMVRMINEAIASETETVEVMPADPRYTNDGETIYDYQISEHRTYTLYVVK